MNAAQSHNALVNGTQGRDTRPTEEEINKAAAIRARNEAAKRHAERTSAGLAIAKEQRRNARLADLKSGWNGVIKVTPAEAAKIITAEGLEKA